MRNHSEWGANRLICYMHVTSASSGNITWSPPTKGTHMPGLIQKCMLACPHKTCYSRNMTSLLSLFPVFLLGYTRWCSGWGSGDHMRGQGLIQGLHLAWQAPSPLYYLSSPRYIHTYMYKPTQTSMFLVIDMTQLGRTLYLMSNTHSQATLIFQMQIPMKHHRVPS